MCLYRIDINNCVVEKLSMVCRDLWCKAEESGQGGSSRKRGQKGAA